MKLTKIIAPSLVLLLIIQLIFVGLPVAQATKLQWDNNGHYYEIVTKELNWDEAKTYAENQQFTDPNTGLVYKGHLATITSPEENSWIVQNIILPMKFVPINGVNIAFWLGGYKEQGYTSSPAGAWHWITDEPWSWTNWYQGEPNDTGGEESYLQMYDWIMGVGKWNDNDITGRENINYILIEYEPSNLYKISSRNITAYPGSQNAQYIPLGNGKYYTYENIPFKLWMGISVWHNDTKKILKSTLNLSGYSAKSIHLLEAAGYADNVPDNVLVGHVRVYYKDDTFETLDLISGENIAEWAYDKEELQPFLKHAKITPAYSFLTSQDSAQQYYGHWFYAKIDTNPNKPLDRLELILDANAYTNQKYYGYSAADWYMIGINAITIEGSTPGKGCNGIVSGYVYDAVTGNPIQGAGFTLCDFDCRHCPATDDKGFYEISSRCSLNPPCPLVTYKMTCEAEGYESETRDVKTDADGNAAQQNFRLNPKAKPSDCNSIISINGEPAACVKAYINGAGLFIEIHPLEGWGLPNTASLVEIIKAGTIESTQVGMVTLGYGEDISLGKPNIAYMYGENYAYPVDVMRDGGNSLVEAMLQDGIGSATNFPLAGTALALWNKAFLTIKDSAPAPKSDYFTDNNKYDQWTIAWPDQAVKREGELLGEAYVNYPNYASVLIPISFDSIQHSNEMHIYVKALLHHKIEQPLSPGEMPQYGSTEFTITLD